MEFDKIFIFGDFVMSNETKKVKDPTNGDVESKEDSLSRARETYEKVLGFSKSNFETLPTKQHLELLLQSDEIERKKDEHALRMVYLRKSFFLVSFIIMITMAIVVLSAVGVYKISDAVLIALSTTMVANVIGILLIAFYWLYHKK